MIKCEICEKEFKKLQGFCIHIIKKHKISSKEYYDKYLKKDEKEGICYCGKQTNFYRLKTGYLKYCSEKCAQNSEELKEKKIQTSLKNFGVEYTMQSKKIQEKTKETCLERYGGIGFASNELAKKSRDTILDKYGVKSYSQTKEFKEKQKEKNSGENNYMWNPDREEVYAPYTEKFFNKCFRTEIWKEQSGIDLVSKQPLEDNAHLHHIDYDKQNDSRDNLIFLNSESHGRTNSNRDIWQKKLTEINKNIIKGVLI